jgi:hypothetical protein
MRIVAASPPPFVLKQLEAIDSKYAGIWRSPGQPLSPWERKALQELRSLAGEDEPPHREGDRSGLAEPVDASSAPPAEPPGAAATHRGPEAQLARRLMALKPSEEETLVAYAKETWGGLDIVPGRDITHPALAAKLGRLISRADCRAVLGEAGIEGTRGRRKNPAN